MNERRNSGIAVYAESNGISEAAFMPAFTARVASPYAEDAILAAGGRVWTPASPAETAASPSCRRLRVIT